MSHLVTATEHSDNLKFDSNFKLSRDVMMDSWRGLPILLLIPALRHGLTGRMTFQGHIITDSSVTRTLSQARTAGLPGGKSLQELEECHSHCHDFVSAIQSRSHRRPWPGKPDLSSRGLGKDSCQWLQLRLGRRPLGPTRIAPWPKCNYDHESRRRARPAAASRVTRRNGRVLILWNVTVIGRVRQHCCDDSDLQVTMADYYRELRPAAAAEWTNASNVESLPRPLHGELEVYSVFSYWHASNSQKRNSNDTLWWIEIRLRFLELGPARPGGPARLNEIRGHASMYFAVRIFKLPLIPLFRYVANRICILREFRFLFHWVILVPSGDRSDWRLNDEVHCWRQRI